MSVVIKRPREGREYLDISNCPSSGIVRLSIVSKGLAYSTRVAAQNFAIWRRAISISARRGQTVAHKRNGTATRV
jgi:hypothetical protein